MTLQEIFDKSIRTIIQQGGPSVGTNGSGGLMCCYRGPEGRMCAAGPFIPDADYKPWMEGQRVSSLPLGLDIHQEALLINLQTIHDTSALEGSERIPDDEFFPIWKRHLRGVALRHGVEPTVLEEIPT